MGERFCSQERRSPYGFESQLHLYLGKSQKLFLCLGFLPREVDVIALYPVGGL